MFSSSASSPFEYEWPADKEEESDAGSWVTALVLFLLLFGAVLLAIFAYAGMMGATDSRGEHTDEEIIGSKGLGRGPSPPIKSTGYVVTRAVTKESTAITTAGLTTTPRPNGAEVAARLIEKAINRTFAPCDDFYNFVCSTYSGGHVYEKIAHQTRQGIWKMLVTMPVPKKFQRATEKAAALVRACIRLASNRQRSEMDGVKTFLRRLYLDISDLEYDPNFPVLHRIIYLSFIYGFPAFIKFSTTSSVIRHYVLMHIHKNDENWMKNSHAKFSGPALESYYGEYLSAYDSKLNVTAVAKDIIRVERIVMNFLATLRKQPFTSFTVWAGKLGILTKGYASNAYWMRLIELATANSIKATNAFHLPDNAAALLVLLLDKTRMRRNESQLLIAWSLVRRLVPLASGKFMNSEALTSYPSDRYRVPRLCREYVLDVMNLAASQRYISTYLPPSALASVKHLAGNLMQTLMKKLNETEWIQGNLWCVMYEKALKLRLNMAYPGRFGTQSFLEQFFFDVPDVTDSFTTPYLAARRLMTMNTFRNDFAESFDPSGVNAYYHPTYKSVTIQAGLLQPPVFIPGAPAAFNYGAIGQITGHEVMHAFDVNGIQSNDRQVQARLENATAKQMYTSKLLCLRSLYMQAESESRSRSLDARTDSEGFADMAGIELSYAAYRNLQDEERWATVPDIGLTSEQTFFVSHCLKWCTTVPGTQRARGNAYWHSRSRCIVPLRNMPEFAEAFSCKPGDRMNPVKKCSFW